jgi:hypothetical protein
MADWDEPTVTTDYDVVFTISNEKFEDSAKMFDGSTSTNIPTGAYRINGAGANELQKYNGSSWNLQNLKLNTVTATTFTGNATTATTAAKITAANEATDNNCFPLFVTAATGDQAPKTNTSFTFNSDTGDVAIGGDLVLNAALTSANSNIFTVTNSYVSNHAFIDLDFSNTSNNAVIRHMRSTATSGDRKSVWYKGDGTNTSTMSLDHNTGNLDVGGNVNGRDMAADGTKLDTLPLVPAAGEVGSTLLLSYNGAGVIGITSDNVSGSSLQLSNADGSSLGGNPSGSWRCQGRANGSGSGAAKVCIFIRVS